MKPPRKPPDGEHDLFPGKRYPFWTRRSDRHPRVEPYPGAIKDGVAQIISDLKALRSPSPDGRAPSRFPSQPYTPRPTPHPPSHRPEYSYPPPPPPCPHPCAMTMGTPSQSQGHPYHLPQPVPLYSHPPTTPYELHPQPLATSHLWQRSPVAPYCHENAAWFSLNFSFFQVSLHSLTYCEVIANSLHSLPQFHSRESSQA